MPFEISLMTEEEITSDGVFKDLIDAEWDSYEHPYTRLLGLFFPIVAQGPKAHAERIRESLNRQLSQHRSTPCSRWLKAIDTETGEIAGGAQWYIFTENPYAVPLDGEVTWWADGEDRDFATALIEQFLTPRLTYMPKPHIHLEACFTRPKYRRQGLGKLFMEWGIQKADELRLESYIDASELGAHLYEGYGFVSPGWVHITAPVNDEPSARWKQLKELLLPFKFKPQWRPIGGKFDESIQKPWEI